MKSPRKTSGGTERRVRRRSSRGKSFQAVMHALESVSANRSFSDPILEQLQQCPEAFRAGEMIGKMFDTLKYRDDNQEGSDRLLPPAGLVAPLF